MTVPIAVSAPGVRGGLPAAANRSPGSPGGTAVPSADAFAAALRSSRSDQRRPAARPAERPEAAQARRVDPVPTRRADPLPTRGGGVAQRDRPGPVLGVVRPRSIPAAAGVVPSEPTASESASAGGAPAPVQDQVTTSPTLVDGSVLLAQQLAVAAGPTVGQPPVEVPDEVAESAAPVAAAPVPPVGPAPVAVGAQPATDTGTDTATATDMATAAGTRAVLTLQTGSLGADRAPAEPAVPAVPRSSVPAQAGVLGGPAAAALPSTLTAADLAAVHPAATTLVVDDAAAGGTTADLAHGGPGSPASETATMPAPAQPASTTPSSSVVQSLAGLTPTTGAERLAQPVAASPVSAPQAPTLADQVRGPLVALRHAAPGEHTLTLQVTPESLGPVQVKAHIGAAGVRIELIGATDASRDSLRALLTDLRRDLAGTGMNASLSLAGDPARPQGGLAGEWSGTQQDARGGRTDARPPGDGSGPAAEVPTPETPRPTPPTTGARGVDVLT